MHPSLGGVRDRDQRREWIESANIEFASLQHNDGGISASGELRLQRLGANLARFIDHQRFDAVRTKTKEAQGPVNRTMPLGAGEHPHPRSAEIALAGDIPTLFG